MRSRIRLADSLLSGLGWSVSVGLAVVALTAAAEPPGREALSADPATVLSNSAYRLKVSVADGVVRAKLDDLLSGCLVADGPCLYFAAADVGEDETSREPSLSAGEGRSGGTSLSPGEGRGAMLRHPAKHGGPPTADRLEGASMYVGGTTLTIRGKLLGLDVEHRFVLPTDRPVMEERVILKNNTNGRIALGDLEVGLQRRIAGRWRCPQRKGLGTPEKNTPFADAQGVAPGVEGLAPDLAADRLIAVPLRHRASDPKDRWDDFSFRDIATRPGREVSVDRDLVFHEAPSRHRPSEGWAWTHGDHVLGIFKFCQEHLQFSVVSTHPSKGPIFLRIGGAAMISGEPSALHRVAPGETVDLGVVRYQTLRGGHREACYAFRRMLDEFGCRFPKDYDPPVHWEQLYDMVGAWDDRAKFYTKAIVEREAALGQAYHCEALYLDPGWDTSFGSFLWGEKWLGPRRQFVAEMQAKYGLKVSLHCPLATWVSGSGQGRIPLFGPSALGTYPSEARRTPPDPKEKTPNGRRCAWERSSIWPPRKSGCWPIAPTASPS